MPGRQSRLLVTLLAPLLVLAARRLPLPGVALDPAHLPREAVALLAGKLSPVALGLAPYLAAALLVELVAALIPSLRALRVSGLAGRAKLARATALVFLALAAVQGLAVARNITLFDEQASLPRMTLTFVAGSAALLILANFVGRRGLANGLLVVVGSNAAIDAVELAMRPHEGPLAAPLVVGAACVLTMFATAFVLRRSGAATSDAASGALLAPSTGIWPVKLGAGALGATVALSAQRGGPFAAWLERATGHATAWVVLTVGLVVALSPLLSDPSLIAPLWARVTGKPVAEVEAELKKAASDAVSPTLTFCLLLVLAAEAAAVLVGGALDVVGIAIATALALDAASEYRARKVTGALAPVWSEVRPYGLAAAGQVLADAGIAFHARDERQRVLLHALGPFAPSEIRVAPGDASRAATLLADKLGPPTTGGEASALKAFSGASVGAAIAVGVALLVGGSPPSLPAPLGSSMRIEAVAARRVTLAIVPVDDGADPFAAATAPPGVRFLTELTPVAAGREELRRYAVVVAKGEGEEVVRAMDAQRPFFEKIALPAEDRLAFGPEHATDDAGNTSILGLRTWVLRDEPPAVTEADVAEVVSLPASSGEPPSLGVRLSPAGTERFRALTARWAPRRIAIVIDGSVELAIPVAGEIASGRLQISPGGSDAAAQQREVDRLARGLAPH